MFGNSDGGRGGRDLDREFERGGMDRRGNEYDNRGYGAGQNNRAAYGEHAGEMESRSAVYLAKVMGWMCVGLLTTVVTAMAALTMPAVWNLVFGGPGFFVVVIAQFVMVIALSAGIQRMSPATATVMFMAYSALTGLTMSVFVLIYDIPSLILAFSVTTFVFLTMSIYGFVTKKDLTTLGRLAFFGLIGIIAASLLNMFLGNPMMDLAITVVGVLVFIGLIAYDTQNIKGIYQQATASGYDEYSDEVRKLAIIGALKLYLDFINLFIMLLRLLGRRR
ncbi:MAG: Bax inhibitor-1/YccA family protein [Oscillospiraceae bacterium]|nr:Bax inhibitor-1/YccA family protein [Oscillospiraceae bacterium]